MNTNKLKQIRTIKNNILSKIKNKLFVDNGKLLTYADAIRNCPAWNWSELEGMRLLNGNAYPDWYVTDYFQTCKDLNSFFYGASASFVPSVFVNNVATNIVSVLREVSNFETLEWNCEFKNATNAEDAFYRCYSLKLITLDAPKITNGCGMFARCQQLTKIQNETFLNLENASEMFCCCSELTTVQIDSTNITTFHNTFAECSKLLKMTLRCDNATDLYGVFCKCSSISEITLLNTQNVLDFDYGFSGCRSLTKLVVGSLDNLCRMAHAFDKCINLTTIELNNIQNVTNVSYAFSGCNKLNSVVLNGNLNITYAYYMFSGCSALTNLVNLGDNIQSLYGTYNSCGGITNVVLKNMSNLSSMAYCFMSCSNLTDVNISNCKNLRTLYGSFSYCTRLNKVEIHDIITTSNLDIDYCFYDNRKLNRCIFDKTVNISGMLYSFYLCGSLTYLQLGTIGEEADLRNAFSFCTNLENLYIDSICCNMSSYRGLSYCTKLTQQSLLLLISALSATSTKKYITFGTTNLSKLTEELIAVATAKGWTLN